MKQRYQFEGYAATSRQCDPLLWYPFLFAANECKDSCTVPVLVSDVGSYLIMQGMLNEQ